MFKETIETLIEKKEHLFISGERNDFDWKINKHLKDGWSITPGTMTMTGFVDKTFDDKHVYLACQLERITQVPEKISV
jgi:hypothetical protein